VAVKPVKLVHFTTVMLYVLVCGVMWGTWLALARTMTEYDATTFLADGQHMIANLATIMAVLLIAAVGAGLVATWVSFRHQSATAGWLSALGLLFLVGVLVVTLAVEVPIDNQIAAWTTQSLPSDWQDTRARWAIFHTVRTFLSLAAVALALGAALAPRQAARS
jgi:uncharacterized membrane protein